MASLETCAKRVMSIPQLGVTFLLGRIREDVEVSSSSSRSKSKLTAD